MFQAEHHDSQECICSKNPGGIEITMIFTNQLVFHHRPTCLLLLHLHMQQELFLQSMLVITQIG